MKKKLESKLVNIAHRIIALEGKKDVLKMHAEIAALHEALSVLKFAYDNFEDDIPTIENNSSFFEMLGSAFNNTISDTIEVEDKIYINVDEVEDDGIMEPAINKIKDIVAEMPKDSEKDAINDLFKPITEPTKQEMQLEDFTADYKNIPVFEAVDARDNQVKKSLNQQLKGKALQIGLNDKIAFIKHLFDNKSEDYERVLSQINTSASFEEAQNLIHNIVKPDYNNWEGKEEFETRFIELVENKYE